MTTDQKTSEKIERVQEGLDLLGAALSDGRAFVLHRSGHITQHVPVLPLELTDESSSLTAR